MSVLEPQDYSGIMLAAFKRDLDHRPSLMSILSMREEFPEEWQQDIITYLGAGILAGVAMPEREFQVPKGADPEPLIRALVEAKWIREEDEDA